MHVYTTFCLCIHPSKDTCYYLLAIVNNAAMNIGIQISFWVPAFNFSGYLPRGGIPGSYGSCMHTHQQGTRVPVSPHLCQHLLFCFIGSSHSGCEVIAIWIYLIISDAEHLLMSLLAICISLLEKCLLLGPFFLNWIFFFFGCWLASLHLFSSVDPWYMTCEYFTSFCRMPFHFVECFFCYAESFNFDEV